VSLIRPATPDDAPAIARVHVAAWEQAYRGLIADEVIDARTIELRTEQWTSRLRDDGCIAYVACDRKGKIQGFGNAVYLEDAPFDTYLQTLYVAPEAWRQGIGRAILRGIAAHLASNGAKNMALSTLRLGEARAFYERLGARVFPEGLDYDTQFDGVVYAFDDLAVLTNG
jgi:GNAT superfamily N-acetyltransferase